MPKFKCEGAYRKPPACSYSADARWRGPCPGCGRIYKIVRLRAGGGEDDGVGKSLAALASSAPIKYRPTGVDAWDRVIGGGFVDGTIVLLGGPRGCGKTTLLLQVMNGYAEKTGRRGLYVSSEESLRDIGHVAQRLQITSERVHVLGNESDVLKVVAQCEDDRPGLLVWDSVQTAIMEDLEADIGTATQVDAIANYLQTFVKTLGTTVVLVGHVNKRKEFAGTEKLQHLVDTIVYFRSLKGEEDGFDNVRELSIDGKNRKGLDDVTALLEMTPEGLRPFQRRSKVIYATSRSARR